MDVRPFQRVRLLSVMLLSLLLVAVAACDQPTQSNALPDQQQILRVGTWGFDLQSLDPALHVSYFFSYADQIQILLYTRLTDLDASQHPTLSAAKAVRVSPDGLTYTFTLRPNLRFSDGAAITSADIAYSLNRAISPCLTPPQQYGAITNMRSASSLASDLLMLKDSATFHAERCDLQSAIHPADGQHAPLVTTLIGDSIRTPDPATIVLTLDHPDDEFLVNLARPVASIVEQRLIEQYGDTWTAHLTDNGGQGTSGMYALQFADTHSTPYSDTIGPMSVTLTRSHTWALTQPRLRQIHITIPPVEHHRDTYLAGQIDLLPTLEGDGALFQASHDPGYHDAPAPSLDYLALNWQIPPFNDVRVRQAFALALDKTQIAPLYPRALVQPTNHLVPEGVTGYNASLTGPLGVTTLTGDPTKARALWLSYVNDTCGGNASKCPEARLTGASCGPLDIPEKIAQLMVSSWQQAMPGIRVSFLGNRYPSCVLFGRPQPPCLRSQIVRFDWDADMFQQRAWLAPLFDPGDPQYAFVDPTGGTSHCTQDTQAIELLHSAGQTPDVTSRIHLYQRAEQQLVDDVAMIPLFQYRATWEVRPNVTHYPTAYRPWIGQSEWATIYLAKH